MPTHCPIPEDVGKPIYKNRKKNNDAGSHKKGNNLFVSASRRHLNYLARKTYEFLEDKFGCVNRGRIGGVFDWERWVTIVDEWFCGAKCSEPVIYDYSSLLFCWTKELYDAVHKFGQITASPTEWAMFSLSMLLKNFDLYCIVVGDFRLGLVSTTGHRQ